MISGMTHKTLRCVRQVYTCTGKYSTCVYWCYISSKDSRHGGYGVAGVCGGRGAGRGPQSVVQDGARVTPGGGDEGVGDNCHLTTPAVCLVHVSGYTLQGWVWDYLDTDCKGGYGSSISLGLNQVHEQCIVMQGIPTEC